MVGGLGFRPSFWILVGREQVPQMALEEELDIGALFSSLLCSVVFQYMPSRNPLWRHR